MEGRQSVVLLAPMGAHNAIAVEAWQAVAQWDVQTDCNGVRPLRHGRRRPRIHPDPRQPEEPRNGGDDRRDDAYSDSQRLRTDAILPRHRSIRRHSARRRLHRHVHARAASACPDMRGLRRRIRPQARTRPRAGLLDTARLYGRSQGAASLDWSATTAISSWEGVALNANSTRVKALELDDEDLDGTIPPTLGRRSALETLDLSDNDLSGELPEELGRLWSLRTLRLSGNSFSGCIPTALKSVASNDLSSLKLPYCPPPGSTPTPTPTPTPTATPTPTPTLQPSPDAPTVTGLVAGSSPNQLVVSRKWDGDSCFITGTSSGYEINYTRRLRRPGATFPTLRRKSRTTATAAPTRYSRTKDGARSSRRSP